jgi:hypothetical protein
MTDAELIQPAMLKKLGAYATTHGITRKEMLGHRDPRLLRMVWLAMTHEAMDGDKKKESTPGEDILRLLGKDFFDRLPTTYKR